MASWIAKACAQKIASGLPESWRHPANEFFRRHLTKGALLTDPVFAERIASAALHVEAGFSSRHEPVIELGTGWYPVIPVALYVCGFSSITSVDLVHHLTTERLSETARKFIELHERKELRDRLPHYDVDRVGQLRKAVENRARSMAPDDVGLTLLTGDASRLPLPDACAGFIFSNSVFEHIYPQTLEPILIEFRRLLRPGGCMSHAIDLSDHFSHVDKKITPYNFLRFSDRAWNIIDNPIQAQSRLRVDDYRLLFDRTGWHATAETTKTRSEPALQQIKLDRRFSSKPPAINAVTEMNVILKAGTRSSEDHKAIEPALI